MPSPRTEHESDPTPLPAADLLSPAPPVTPGDILTTPAEHAEVPFDEKSTANFSLKRTAVPAPALPKYFGKYELIQEVASGGMGRVFKARDTVLDRVVALKMIKSGLFADSDEVDRFLMEAKSVAQLKHRNIIQILDYGQEQGQPFFTMPLAEGGSLLRHLDRFDDPTRAATLIEKVARAVQAIHDAGKLHRDLKPGNILLEAGDEPLVSDFGLVKAVEGDSHLTGAGEALGTPAYMAPEQASLSPPLQGVAGGVSPQTDIWSLGVILYELVGKQKPFSGVKAQIVHAILHDDPKPPRQLRPKLSRDLETIILKCLEKDPRRRYASAGALADDLGCWLRGEPIRARPLSLWGKVCRKAKRHRRAVAGVLLFAAALSTILLTQRRQDVDSILHSRIYPQLERHEWATLIDERGPPLRHIWRLPGAVLFSGANEIFSIHSGTRVGLLELLPDPKLRRFRFEADVRDDSAGSGGCVGIYCGYGRQQTEMGEIHTCLVLGFADQDKNAKRMVEGSKDGKPAFEPDGMGRFFMVHASNPPPAQGFFRTTQQGRFKHFTPAWTTGESKWRRLAVDVTAEEIRAWWDTDVQPFCVFPTARRLAEAKRTAAALALGSVPDFPPAGPVGLYVAYGGASFRNVKIGPRE